MIKYLIEEVITNKEEIIEVFDKTNIVQKYPLHRPADLIDMCDICVKIKNNNKTIGYALINTHNKHILSESDKLYNKNYITNGIYIEQVAILPEYENQGLGVNLYSELFKYLKNKYSEYSTLNIYSHVATENKQSLKFHCKQGFIPIGDFKCDNFYGYENYHSLLLELII